MADTTHHHNNTVEMQQHQVVVPAARTYVGPASAWPRWTLVSCAHLLAALLLLATAIAAAVGLGQDDWYVREFSAAGPSTVGLNGGGSYITDYYGLRRGTSCPFASRAYPSNIDDLQTRWSTCRQTSYEGQKEFYDLTGQDDYERAYHQLEAAGKIVIVMLSLALTFALIGALINFFHAFHYSLPHWFSNRPRHHRLARLLALLALICVLLAMIFWITIFPYRRIHDLEDSVYPATYVSYHHIGTGFAIQIAGFILALIAFIITRHNPHTHDNHHHNNAGANTHGAVALPHNNV